MNVSVCPPLVGSIVNPKVNPLSSQWQSYCIHSINFGIDQWKIKNIFPIEIFTKSGTFTCNGSDQQILL